jgi:ABC-type multidrug transport system ATPase subunit
MIGVQPQTPGFQDKTKLTELIQMFAAAYGEKVDPKKFLDEVNLGEKADAYIENLSGGQKQRFSIVAALVHNPKVFFLDEPTTGLDPGARRNLWKLIEEVRDRGISVILTTHYMDEAEILCDRIAIMDQGKIVKLDTPKNLIKQLLSRGFTKEQHVEQANLEDVFIDLTGKGLKEYIHDSTAKTLHRLGIFCHQLEAPLPRPPGAVLHLPIPVDFPVRVWIFEPQQLGFFERCGHQPLRLGLCQIIRYPAGTQQVGEGQ